MTGDDPDSELLEQVGRNEPAAVREMVARKLPRILNLATRMLGDRGEAEDVAQEAFIRLWRHAPMWERGRARFDTWLHRVALNLCYDRLRGRRDQPMGGSAEVSDGEEQSLFIEDASADAPDTCLERVQYSERVGAALAVLPGRQREALVLQYYQELSNVEAASAMGISVEALESLLSRARRNLRQRLLVVDGSPGALAPTDSTDHKDPT